MYVCKKYNNDVALFVKFQPKMKAFWIFFWQDWQNQVHHNTSSPLSRSSQLINSKLFSSKYSNTEICSCVQCVQWFINKFPAWPFTALIYQICQIYIFIWDEYLTIKIWDSWAKISFNIILLNLAVRIIAIFLLIDLFVFSSWWWMFDRYISIIDRKMSNTNEYLINRFTSNVWKNSIVRHISIIEIVMVAPQRACHWGTTWSNKKEITGIPDLYFQNRN